MTTVSASKQQLRREAPWWTRSTVYQIYPRSFADSNGDGIGDLRGINQHLDHLVALGVDVVWLSPIYRSPHDDNGYDISDYRAIDPAFGTLDDFDELLAGLHDCGIKLLMDLVVNHTSDEHAWFAESRSSTSNDRRDWYWWRPARDGFEPGSPGAEPTNWESFFSGSTWQFDEATGEYYLHLFSPKQPDLNWEHPPVRAAIYEMMRWWLDRGIDGFRMDVINVISKTIGVDGSLADGPIVAGAPFGDGSAHYFGGPRLHEYLAEMRREVFDHYDRPLLTVGETPSVAVADARLLTDPARGELDMVFQFEHMEVDHAGSKWNRRPFDLVALKSSLDAWQAGLAEVGWNSLYWNNHDQPRVVSRFGDDGEYRVRSAKCLATVLHLLRGTPYVYQGEELGMTNVAFDSIDDYRDVETLRYYDAAVRAGEDPAATLASIVPASRDNARTPMQWDDGPTAGFTTGTPWIAVNGNAASINAAAARADESSVFHHYRRLIALRRDDDVVALGAYAPVLAASPEIAGGRRWLPDDAAASELLTLANCSSGEVTVDLVDVAADLPLGVERLAETIGDAATIVLATVESPPAIDDTTLTLRPWEAVVWRLPGAASPEDDGIA